MSEEEISLLLDTFMYLDYKEATDGMSLAEIMEKLSGVPDCMVGGIHYEEYQILKQAAGREEIGQLIIGNQSHLLGYDSGTAACSFQTPDKSCTYIVYRGTGDGEWVDNGSGMTKESTIQQEKALSYFETVIERENITSDSRLIITGHSKGGNKAQYVTMSTKYDELPDACYNVDGQGFSETAIEKWKSKLGEEEYEKRRNKITGIYGENDYVNVLGHSIVPEDKVYYIKTPADKNHFAAYHDITYMFAKQRKNSQTGEWEIIFDGVRNDYALKRGKIGDYVAKLSDEMMKLPKIRRDGCAAVLMQIMESVKGSYKGINGEKISLLDVDDFLWKAIPLISSTTFLTGQGLSFLQAAFFEDTYAVQMQGNVNFILQTTKLKVQVNELYGLALQTEKEVKEIDAVLEEAGNVRMTEQVYHKQLMEENAKLKRIAKKCRKLAGKISDVIEIYKAKDEEAALFFL